MSALMLLSVVVLFAAMIGESSIATPIIEPAYGRFAIFPKDFAVTNSGQGDEEEATVYNILSLSAAGLDFDETRIISASSASPISLSGLVDKQFLELGFSICAAALNHDLCFDEEGG